MSECALLELRIVLCEDMTFCHSNHRGQLYISSDNVAADRPVH
jgi:hypothetical protein